MPDKPITHHDLPDVNPDDPHVVETNRVYAEYNAARAAHLDDRTDPIAKGRYDRASQAVYELRNQWREIGEAVGLRKQGAIATDNTEALPALVTPEA